MASNDEDLCTSHADFAVICSFIDKFGEKLGLTLPNIGELQSSLEDTDNVNPLVSQCVSQLLRRINKSVKLDRWERGLQRFAHSYSHQDGWELERFGFKKAKLEVKIRVLKNLLEAQFDLYKSFKDKVNLLGANELRLQPCGRDKKGVSYWCQLDECANLRVYSDDQDDETWTLVASTREELVALIAELDSESPPGASREMSVDGSHSGTATPMGLSEAPTPVDSKAPTPVASGRTSPVIDTGQDGEKKDKPEESKEMEAKVEVEKVKEKLESGDDVQKLKEESDVKLEVGDKMKEIFEIGEKVKEKLGIAEKVKEKLEVGEKVKEKLEREAFRDKERDEGRQRTEDDDTPKMSNIEIKEQAKVETKVKENVTSIQNPQDSKESRVDIKAKTDDMANDKSSSKAENEKDVAKVEVKEEICDKVEENVKTKKAGDSKEVAKQDLEEKETIKLEENKNLSRSDEDKNKPVVKVEERGESSRKADEKGKVCSKLDKSEKPSIRDEDKGKTCLKAETKEASSTRVEDASSTTVKAEEKEKIQEAVLEEESVYDKLKTRGITIAKNDDKQTVSATERERAKVVVKAEEKDKISPKSPVEDRHKLVVKEEAKELDRVKVDVKDKTGVKADVKDKPGVKTDAKDKPGVKAVEEKVGIKVERRETVIVKEEEREKTTATAGAREKTEAKADVSEKVEDKAEEKQLPSVKVEEKQQPTVRVEEKQQPTVKVQEKQLPTVKVEEKPQTTVKVEEKQQPTVKVEEKQLPTVKVEEKQQPTVKVEEKQLPTVKVEEKQQPTVKVEEKQLSSVKVQDKPQTTVKVEEKQLSLVKVEEKQQPTVKVDERGKREVEEDKNKIREEKEKIVDKLEKLENGSKTEVKEKAGNAGENKKDRILDRPVMEAAGSGKLEVAGNEAQKVPSKGLEEGSTEPVTTDEKRETTGKAPQPPKPVPLKLSEAVKKDTVVSAPSTDKTQEGVIKVIQPDATTKAICEDIAAKKDMVHEIKDRLKLASSEKLEVKRKESVWDKLNKMKEKGEASALEKECTYKGKDRRMGEIEKKDEMYKKYSIIRESSSNPQQLTSTKIGHETAKVAAEVSKVGVKDEKDSVINKEPQDKKLVQQDGKPAHAILGSQPNLDEEKLNVKVSDSAQRLQEEKKEKPALLTGVELTTVREPVKEPSKLMSVTSLATSSTGKSNTESVVKSSPLASAKMTICAPTSAIKDADTAEPPQKKFKIMDVLSESQKELAKIEHKGPVNPLHQKQDAEIPKPIEKNPDFKTKLAEMSGESHKDHNVKVSELQKTEHGPSVTKVETIQKESIAETKTKDEKLSNNGTTTCVLKEETRTQTVLASNSKTPKEKQHDESAESSGVGMVVNEEASSHKTNSSVETKREAHGAIDISKDTALENKLLVTDKKEEKMDLKLNTSKECAQSEAPIKEDTKVSLTETSKKELEKSILPDKEVPRICERISETPVQCSSKNLGTDDDSKNDVKDPVVKNVSQVESEETNTTTGRDDPKSSKTEQGVGEAIEEPVMIVKGDGEGASCEAGNPLYERSNDESSCQTLRPWWECFHENDNTRRNQVEEAVVEDVMYFWGEGNGADCDAGNNGDETDTSTETKPAESGGSGSAVTGDKQGNTASGDCKPQKEVEGLRTESDVKEVDGVSEGDEAKVNGLRTIESVEKSDKSLSWQVKPECLSDAIHSSVNGKKAGEENSVCNDKGETKSLEVHEKDSDTLEEKRKHSKPHNKGNKEQIINNTDFKGNEGKGQVSDSEDKPSSDKIGLRKTRKEQHSDTEDKPSGDLRKTRKEQHSDSEDKPSGDKIGLRKTRKEQVCDSEDKPSSDKIGLRKTRKEHTEVANEENLIELKKGKDNSSKVNTRNRSESKRKRQRNASSNNDKDERNAESGKEEETIPRRRGLRRPLDQPRSTEKEKSRPQKRSAEQCQGSGGEEENEIDHDEDNEEEGAGEDEDKNTAPTPSKKRRQRGKGSTARPLPDVPRQRSARIAKIREKEEEERRNLEAMRLKQLAEENRLRELKKKAREERRSQREMKKGRRERKEKKERDRRKRKKKKRGKRRRTNPNDPWAHSSTSSSSSSEEEEEEEDLDDEEEENLIFKSDHEFSPESDIEEADAQPIKRARTAKKVTTESEVEDDDDDAEEDDDDQTQCTKCGHDDHPETILLCDNCDAGWHLSCLRPPLLSVPEGDWVCPTCEHVQLVNKLRALLHEFDECQKRAHNEELRRQRLAYVNVSLSNVLPDGKKKKKRRHRDGEDDDDDDDDESGSESDTEDSDSESDDSSDSSSQSSSDSTAPLYTLRARSSRTLKEQVEDFDEMINEAIRDEMEAAAGAGNAGRGKDIDNIIQANDEEIADNEDKHSEDKEEKQELEEEQEQEKEQVKELKEEVEQKQELEKEEQQEQEHKEDVSDQAKTEVAKKEEAKKEEDMEGKREWEGDDEDEDEVAPKRKKPKPAEKVLRGDDDYKESDDQEEDSESEDNVKVSRKRERKVVTVTVKKRRRLTDLDAEDDDDASDEDFMNTSEEEEEETDESVESSSSIDTDVDSDDSDVVGGKRRRGSRWESLPLRRSARNRRGGMDDEDSEVEEKFTKKQKNKKKKRRRQSSSEEEEASSESDRSYKRKKKVSRKKKPQARSKGKKGKSKGGRKQAKSKTKPKRESGDEGEDKEKKPPKPRIKYSKPPKPKSEENAEEEITQRRVTRGRQVNYYDALMSDETEEEEPAKKWRGKVMKGERVPTESSEYEASDDERMKRRGVSGGLGRGKVMKGEEEDEENKLGQGKKKRGRPKKGDELIGKPSPPSTLNTIEPSSVSSTPSAPSLPIVSSESTVPVTPIGTSVTVKPIVTPVSVTPVVTPMRVTPVVTSVSITPVVTSTPITPTIASLPAALTIASLPAALTIASLPSSITIAAIPAALPVTAAPVAPAAASSPAHKTPEHVVGTPPTTPAPSTASKSLPANITAATNMGNNSPVHQPMGKWSPHLSMSGAPGTPPRPSVGSGPTAGAGTPPRPTLSGPPVTPSPPPPYRSSPLPITPGGPGASPCSTAPSSMAPVGPPITTSIHSPGYPAYRPPPELFAAHPAFPGYAPPGRHSPSPHGVPPHHPSHIQPGHSLSRMPTNYGPPPLTSGPGPGQGPYSSRGIPSHPGVLRGPPHDLYRSSPSGLPGHGSPSHPGHPHLVMKSGYPGLEPLPYSGSPGPSPLGLHQGSQGSPAHHSPSDDSKEETHPTGKGPGEFSSGLMSYFSSQRDDDIE
nr:uncharacterized protein LOC123754093 [Procambarus clarkii]